MKHLHKSILISTVILGLTMIKGFGQTQTKTYSETFKVGDEAVLELNTSNADIEFDTWNKDLVSVEAVVEIEGLAPEEAENYFKAHEVKIMGNSKKIEVSTAGGYNWDIDTTVNLERLNIAIPEIPQMEPFLLELPEMPDMGAMPPLPVAPIPPFDYDAYQEDGEKYLQEWQKDIQNNYGADYQKKMKAWAKKMAVKSEQMEEKRREMTEARENVHEQMEEARNQRREVQQVAREKQREAEEKHREMMAQQREENLAKRIMILDKDRGDNVYYRTSNGKNRNIKIRKTIKIKMPKSVRLKMNVRHGEVKLAENTKNMSANLSYATLLASTIDGVKTNITASYTPVSVQNWNEGQLQADYSESVDLKEVKMLTLNSISSNITIEQIFNSALIKNSFGGLTINYVSPNFSDLAIFLENTDLACTLPQSAFNIQINSMASNIKPSAGLALKKTVDNKKGVFYEGYNGNKNTERNIVINSKYSDIVLK